MILRSVLFLTLTMTVSSYGYTDEITWEKTIDKVSSAIVSIKIDSPKAFDTEWKSSSQATGFVVDEINGIILTNRHVVNPGPVHAEALFFNNEELDLEPIYRDPVHDFGFFRYDPSKLRRIEPLALPLVSEGIDIGEDIRVIGNDAGEKLSILSGIIARMDRPAPDYGRGNYNDFNTFYIQAASGTSGGSSGSPVINIHGEVIALNAGGNNSAASSYFLPLHRVKRALSKIANKEPVIRGTLQVEFESLSLDRLKRLGLSESSESIFWGDSNLKGLLVAKKVIKDSPISELLKPGDILLSINENEVQNFIDLAKILDTNVGNNVSIQIERSGQPISFDVIVTDLNEITPSEFITIGGAVVNNFSYQQARHYNRPTEGVYIADPGYIFSRAAIPAGSVITEMNGKSIKDLDEFERILRSTFNGETVSLRFIRYSDPMNEILRTIEINDKWFATERCSLNLSNGFWPCAEIKHKPSKKINKNRKVRYFDYKDARKNKIAPSLVHVNFDLPYPISGIVDRHYYGTGLIVDKERGLILVDRNTVPIALGDVKLTFSGSLEIPGKIEYIHPLHNIVLLSYETDLIADTPVSEAEFNTDAMLEGEETWLIGLKSDHQLYSQKSLISSIDPLMLPPSLSFQDNNIEVINLVNSPDDIYGVLTDENGLVTALWTSFSYRSRGEAYQINRGIGSELIESIVEGFKKHSILYSLELELNYVPLFAARKLGLSDIWIDKFEALNDSKKRMISVKSVMAGSPVIGIVKPGDIILSINKNLIKSYRDYEVASQSDDLVIELWRNNELLELKVKTSQLEGNGVKDVFFWAGAHIHEPHRALRQRGIENDGVYVAFNNYGSPATRYGLKAGLSIIAVDDIPTPNLDIFKKIVMEKTSNDSIKLNVVSWNGSHSVVTLKLNNKYWPSYEISQKENIWKRNAFL